MAKQIINVGAEANDGTGDPIRSAMQKTNSNFTEIYDLVEDIVIPTVPTKLTDLGISDGANGQVLTTDGSGAFTFESVVSTAAYTNADVDTHLNTSTASALEVLGWTGTDYDWVSLTPVFGTAGVDAHLNTSTATTDQVLGWTGTDYDWVDQSGGGLPSRTAAAGTTASLASNAAGSLNITGFKSYALLTITTDKAAWVRIYANGTTRTADASRAESSDPAPDAGVIAEVITTGAETVIVSPGVIGYNLEATPTTVIPCAVTNKSGSTGTVTVTLNLLQLEA